MPIQFNKENSLFKLDTNGSTYIFGVADGYLVHYYYGAVIPDMNVEHLRIRGGYASFSPEPLPNPIYGFSPDITPMEYSVNGTGDFRISAFSVKSPLGDCATDLRYTGHNIFKGKKPLEGLPALYSENDDDAETLEIFCEDKFTGACVTLSYTVFKEFNAIIRSVTVKNTSDLPFHIEAVHSFCVDLPSSDYDMLDLYGRWAKERSLERYPLHHGIQSIKSKRGSSSHFHNPFTALISHNATETVGECYGFNLVYSSNFSIDAEVDTYGCTRIIGGINPETFSWKLSPGEVFTAPEAVMVYTDKGLGEMSRLFHRLYSEHLIRGKWKHKKRPLLINNWEGTFMDFDDDKLVSFAEHAKDMGFEMLVMDDGWFGHRDDDHTSLGDWQVAEYKLKGGLKSLIDRVNALGLKFGIWYEPEMISPDSDLYRAHPDWCIHVKGRARTLGRNQCVIDFSRKEVRDYIYGEMKKVLSGNKIDYLKWDFNRNITEAGSEIFEADRQGELFHRYILGTYDVMDRLTRDFPDILFENCSGGGGRFDPGMLYYSPQIWCSDNTDPIERLTIQFGTSLCYPASTMGAHVSASVRTGYNTKTNVALWGSFGYELDPEKLSDEQKDEIREQAKLYHKYYHLTHEGELYRLITPFENEFRVAWSFVAPDKSEALVTIVQIKRPYNEFFLLKLQGLKADKYYIDEDTDEVYSGALLMNAGLNLSKKPNRDGESYMIHLTEVK